MTMKRITATLAALAITAGLSTATAPDAEAAKMRRPYAGCTAIVYHHGLPRTIHVRCKHAPIDLGEKRAVPIPDPPAYAERA